MSQTADGQQMVVEDADVTNYRAFQLESWLGTEESWILPAYSPVKGLDFAAGAVITDDETYIVGEIKYLFRAPALNLPGYGLAAGVLVAPFEEFYTYVPVTLPVFDERMVLHGNLGYVFERHEEPHGDRSHIHEDHLFTWGARADVNVHGPFWLLGELFGENNYQPGFQVGFQLEVIPELLEMNLTYGNNFSLVSSGMGFAVGIAWTPAPFGTR